MKKFTLLTCLLIVAFYSQTFAYDIKQENLLLQQLNNAKSDSTRLGILYQLANITTDEQDRHIHYTNTLLEEANKQNNSYYKCQAYLCHIIIAFNTYNAEQVQKWVDLLEPVARKAKLYSLLYEGKRAAIDILNVKKQYELAEKKAQEMLKESTELKIDIGIAYAYQSLGYVNAFNYKYEESAEYFEKSYAIFNSLNRLSSINEVCDRLIEIYAILENNALRLDAIQKQEKIITQQSKDSTSNHREWFLVNYLNYLNYYLDVDNLKEAEKYMRLTEQNYIKGYITYESIYRAARTSYYNKVKNPQRAIAEIDTLIMASSNPHAINALEIKKAKFLCDMGYEQLAIELYKKTWPIKDSLKIDIINKQTEQLKSEYNSDALLLKKAKVNNIAQISFIALIVTMILILTWFMLHSYKIQKRLLKSDREQQKLNNDIILASSSKDKFISNISTSIRGPLNNILKNSLILASHQKLNLQEQQTISENLTTTSDHLIKLVNNILDLSHLEAKTMKYNIANIEIISTLKGIILEESNVLSQIELGKLVWCKLDNKRFTQVIKSIISSARSVNPISISVELNGSESVNIMIYESKLSSSNPLQDIIINNEINSMIIADFNGQYSVNTSNGKICITLSISQIQNI